MIKTTTKNESNFIS